MHACTDTALLDGVQTTHTFGMHTQLTACPLLDTKGEREPATPSAPASNAAPSPSCAPSTWGGSAATCTSRMGRETESVVAQAEWAVVAQRGL